MRICLFTPTFLPRLGGAEVVVDALARQFQGLGHEPVVLTSRPGTAEPVNTPYPVVRYRKPTWPQVFPERLGFALRRQHKRWGFDVILALYGQPPGYSAIRLREQTGVPVVLRCPGGDLYREGKTRRRAHRWRRIIAAYQQADAVVAISPYTEELIREVAPRPRCLARIPNGIDAEQMGRASRRPADFSVSSPYGLCLGNLIPQKGFVDAIDAFADARAGLDDLQLVIVGQGKLDRQLREHAARRGVANRVHFPGQRTGNDKRWFLQHCRFGVMPSREEGFGIVALEFLAAGKPLICTTNPTFDAMYEDGLNGLRVPPGNVAALSRALQTAWRDGFQDLHTINASRLTRFTWPAVAEQYLDLFHCVIDKRRQPGQA